MDIVHKIYKNDCFATVLSYDLDKGGVLILPLGRYPHFSSTPEKFNDIEKYNKIF